MALMPTDDSAPPTATPPSSDPPSPTGRRRRAWVIGGTAAAILAVVVLLVVGLMHQGVGSTIQDALAAGDRPQAPDMDLPVFNAADGVGPEGASYDLRDLRGQVVVLNFWASWCDTCKEEMPLLEGAARGYRARGDRVVVLGVNVQDLPNNARGFLKEYAVSYPNLRDKGDTTKLRYEVGGLPETFIIDQRGRIAVKQVGQLTDIAQISTPVDQLLKERG